jgi:hypothetical protein
MRLRTKLALAGSAILLIAFAFFVSASGQQWLWDHANRNNPPYAGRNIHEVDDDIAMGIGLMPWAYLLPSGLVLGFAAVMFWLGDPPKRKEPN